MVKTSNKLAEESNTTIRYSGNGGLALVTCNGKRADILTGSILSEGSATGICLGDTDLVTTPYSYDISGTSADVTNKSSIKELGSSGSIEAISDRCHAEDNHVMKEDVKCVTDAHRYCSVKHTGVHIVSTDGCSDVAAPIGGTGENVVTACESLSGKSGASGPEADYECNSVVCPGKLGPTNKEGICFVAATLINEESATV